MFGHNSLPKVLTLWQEAYDHLNSHPFNTYSLEKYIGLVDVRLTIGYCLNIYMKSHSRSILF